LRSSISSGSARKSRRPNKFRQFRAQALALK
jgi:hypothetical protein